MAYDNIAKFDKAKADLQAFLDWKSKIGKIYSGSGGGTGYIKEVSCGITIYFQEKDGDKETHCFEHEALQAAITQNMTAILNDAQKILEKQLRDIKKEAKKDYDTLIDELKA